MKKLIVCLAALGLAVGAQAASYNWKTSANMQGVDAASVTDNGSYAAGTTNMKNNGSWTAILALYDVSTGSLVGQSAATTIKYSSTGSKANNTAFDVDAAVLGTTYNYVITITGTQNALTARGEDGDYDYSGATMTTTISGQIATGTMGATTLTSGVPATWTVSGITPASGSGDDPGGAPEPTSGLLLLVGAGLLGLRRKRA